jgi:hypothetical protein
LSVLVGVLALQYCAEDGVNREFASWARGQLADRAGPADAVPVALVGDLNPSALVLAGDALLRANARGQMP